MKLNYIYIKDTHDTLTIDNNELCVNSYDIEDNMFDDKFLEKLNINLKKKYGISNKLFFKIIKKIFSNLQGDYDVCEELWNYIEDNI